MAREEHGAPQAGDTLSASAGGLGVAAPSIELLHATYRERLRHYFLRHAGDSPDVDDLIQQTFLRLAKPDRFAGVDNIEAYVFRTARNLLIERGRAAAARYEKAHVELPAEAIDAGMFSPQRILEGKEELTRAIRALNELPARTRAIFILQRFEGYTYVEIARKLGVTPSAIDKQMGRAISHLAKRFEELK